MIAPISDIDYHSSALRDYLVCWESPEYRSSRGMSEDEAAYHLLEHAGFLDRYSASPSWIAELNRLPLEDRRRLVQAACHYTERMTWPVRARRLLSAEVLSAESLEEIEDLLIRRDALETVWTVARSLVDDLLAADAETGRQLAATRCVAAEIDDELIRRPDVVSVAARVLKALPLSLPMPRELSTGWWWNENARNLEAVYEQSFLLPRRRASLISPAPLRFQSEPQYSLAAATETDQFTDQMETAGQKLLLRAFPKNAGGQMYTVALDPVAESQEVTLLVNGEKIQVLAPPEYVVSQRLVYLSVSRHDFERLTAANAVRSVELTERVGPS